MEYSIYKPPFRLFCAHAQCRPRNDSISSQNIYRCIYYVCAVEYSTVYTEDDREMKQIVDVFFRESSGRFSYATGWSLKDAARIHTYAMSPREALFLAQALVKDWVSSNNIVDNNLMRVSHHRVHRGYSIIYIRYYYCGVGFCFRHVLLSVA